MAETLAELEAQRADLERRIAAERARQREAWNDGLTAITQAVCAYAESASVEVSESTRKNVVTLDLISLVTVRLGYEEGEWGRWLEVASASGVTAPFTTDVVPPPAVVVALVRELLVAQAPPWDEGRLRDPEPDEPAT
jgi:hypothetical protein